MTENGSASLPFEPPEQENIRLREENARLRRGPGTEETFPRFVGKPWSYKLLAGDTVHRPSTLALILAIAVKNPSSWDAKATGAFSPGGPPVQTKWA
jgi:hypothetical protein